MYGKRMLKKEQLKREKRKMKFISFQSSISLELIRFDQVNLMSVVELGTEILEQESS